MRRLPLFVLAIGALLCVAGQGAPRAEVIAGVNDVPPVSEAPMGQQAVRRGVQGPKGLFTARLLLLMNASKGAFGKPTSFAPDLYYSPTDTIQLGLVHTDPMGWQTLPGAGLCLTGKSNGCPHVYDNVGFDFMYGLLFGDVHLSLHSSLYLMQISDPLWPMWTIGLSGKLHFGENVALFFDPQVGITLANRADHEDYLFLPVELQFQASRVISLKLLTGLTGPLSGFADSYRIPVGVGLIGNLNRNVDLGVRFSFDNLLGKVPDSASRGDQRSLALLLTIRS